MSIGNLELAGAIEDRTQRTRRKRNAAFRRRLQQKQAAKRNAAIRLRIATLTAAMSWTVAGLQYFVM